MFQSLKTVFDHFFKHFAVWKYDQTRVFVFDILHYSQPWTCHNNQIHVHDWSSLSLLILVKCFCFAPERHSLGGHIEHAISELTLASFSKRVLLPFLTFENEISFTCKLNSFSYEWLCTRPRFDREAKVHSEANFIYSRVLSSSETQGQLVGSGKSLNGREKIRAKKSQERIKKLPILLI